jgi:hypothetical protein
MTLSDSPTALRLEEEIPSLPHFIANFLISAVCRVSPENRTIVEAVYIFVYLRVHLELMKL